jgi:hypothetical protein
MTKQKWLKKNKIPIVISIVFLVMGLVAGLATHPYLPFSVRFDEKINGVELLGIFCTVMLVWIVTSTLDKRKNTEQNAKALVVKRVEEAYELSLKMNERVISGNLPFIDVTASLKRISLTFKNAHQSLNDEELIVDSKHKERIDSQMTILNDLMTNTPVDRQNGPDCPLKIENDILTFSDARLKEITAAFDTLRDQITTFQLAIYDA